MAMVQPRGNGGRADVETIRKALRAGTVVPPNAVRRAIAKVVSKLDAKETKFFSYQGCVIEQVPVEDHATQLRAAEQIMTWAGMNSRDRETQPIEDSVIVEYDPRTGVMRTIIGTPGLAVQDERDFIDITNDVERLEAKADQMELPLLPREEHDEEVPYEVIKVKAKPGQLPPDVHAALFGNGTNSGANGGAK